VTRWDHQVVWDETGYEDRCLFTGDGGDYYLVFLGHNAEGVRKPQQNNFSGGTTQTESNRIPYLREQSIGADDSYYEERAPADSAVLAAAAAPGRNSSMPLPADGGGSRYVSEDPVSMGLYASRGSIQDDPVFPFLPPSLPLLTPFRCAIIRISPDFAVSICVPLSLSHSRSLLLSISSLPPSPSPSLCLSSCLSLSLPACLSLYQCPSLLCPSLSRLTGPCVQQAITDESVEKMLSSLREQVFRV
jgi:hypothetical protein